MALMKCPECGQDVSEQAATCPHCGYSLKESERKNRVKNAKAKINANMTPIIVIGILALVCAGALLGGSFTLSGKDKQAYDILEKAAVTFKDPTSVRLVSGNFFIGDLYCRISATNSYGARNSTCYEISESGYVKEADKTSVSVHSGYFDDTSTLNIDKINKALAKKFPSE